MTLKQRPEERKEQRCRRQGGGVLQAEEKRTIKDLCGRHLVCPKHSEEAPVARVGRVRGNEGREVMGTTGLLAPCFKT